MTPTVSNPPHTQPTALDSTDDSMVRVRTREEGLPAHVRNESPLHGSE
jgi:hypothetical protein